MIRLIADMFAGRYWRRSSEEWQKTSDAWKQTAFDIKASKEALSETNLRLIAQLREMDQAFYSLYQVAPNWPQMQPIIAKVMNAVEDRMKIENNRIRNLMVGEIKQAYNEPSKLVGRHEGVPIFEVPSIEDKSK